MCLFRRDGYSGVEYLIDFVGLDRGRLLFPGVIYVQYYIRFLVLLVFLIILVLLGRLVALVLHALLFLVLLRA